MAYKFISLMDIFFMVLIQRFYILNSKMNQKRSCSSKIDDNVANGLFFRTLIFFLKALLLKKNKYIFSDRKNGAYPIFRQLVLSFEIDGQEEFLECQKQITDLNAKLNNIQDSAQMFKRWMKTGQEHSNKRGKNTKLSKGQT